MKEYREPWNCKFCGKINAQRLLKCWICKRDRNGKKKKELQMTFIKKGNGGIINIFTN